MFKETRNNKKYEDKSEDCNTNKSNKTTKIIKQRKKRLLTYNNVSATIYT